jgi:nucleotide-binding universal stress UspA family protein
VQEIVTAARELESDLILLSTHGRTGLKHVFLGSVAENIVRLAPCPVLVVRENEREFVPNQVVTNARRPCRFP